MLGWRPAYSIDQTLTDIARWYRMGERRARNGTSFTMADIDAEMFVRYEAVVATQ